MVTLAEKEILDCAGFKYNSDLRMYFKRSARKVFSEEAIDDHETEWLRQRIKEENRPKEWVFYFNSPIEETRKKEIVAELVGVSSI